MGIAAREMEGNEFSSPEVIKLWGDLTDKSGMRSRGLTKRVSHPSSLISDPNQALSFCYFCGNGDSRILLRESDLEEEVKGKRQRRIWLKRTWPVGVGGEEDNFPSTPNTNATVKNPIYWEFPGGLVVRISRFQCRGPGSIPGQGTEILQATPHSAATQKNPFIEQLLCVKPFASS